MGEMVQEPISLFQGRASVIISDITRLNVRAIVNAAKSTLLGGGGVDGAIHRAAGPELLAECALLEGCPTGRAKITKGYNLPASFVIHTVGPVWKGGKAGEEDLLRSCYEESLRLAVEHGIETIAFPAISTGVYRFPKEAAAIVALRTVRGFLDREPSVKQVIFCCFGQDDFLIYNQQVKLLEAEPG